RSTILSAAQQAASAYQRRLGMALDAKPTVTIALVPAFKGGFQGDTTDGSVVSLRFFGDGWDTPNPKAASRAVRFVYHEFFHLWNSRLAHSRDGAR
ncbi:hypothetical protein AAEJ42_21990, partial [Shewanella algae]|uniref:hypothetical protein n=1 Tax=Shewanella algae TaxID=38313 RepID=UPI00313E25E4